MSQNILSKVLTVDPLDSDAVKDAVTVFFQNLHKYKNKDCYQWLKTLNFVINRFPKFCIAHRGTVETYLSHFIDSVNYFHVIEVGKCVHSLQQVRPSQEKTATAKSCWRDQMYFLSQIAHKLLDLVFPNAVEIYKQNNMEKQLESSSHLIEALVDFKSTKSKDASNKKEWLATRLRNVYVFIQAMLVEAYPIAKPIQPQIILDIIVRSLSMSSSNADNITDIILIKTQALKTLDAIVLSLGSNLIPYSPLVFRIVMQTLRWSSDNASSESSGVRCAAYRSLGAWMATLRAHAARAAPELAAHLLRDVTPHTHAAVHLTLNNRPTKNLSKKAKRKLANMMLQESSIASHAPGEKNKPTISEETNEETALAALECAETFLTVCGMFLKPEIHKQFQERLVRECYSLQQYSLRRGLALLRALEAARRAPPPRLAPPTQYCLHLYTMMLNTNNREISRFCTDALLNIRMHLHCSPPSLNYSLEAPHETRKEREKKKMSQRNREAFEALLGPDTEPNSNQDEIIDIAEEPESKKARLEQEFEDKISISSDSETSFEVCDDGYAESENEIDNNDEVIAIEDDRNSEEDNTQEDNDVTDNKNKNIHEAVTQIPVNTSGEMNEERNSPVSMEVAYDYPNTEKETVAVLEKMDDENLPSTNDTDDVQITCGQKVKSSQDERKDTEIASETIEINGVELLEKEGVESTEKKIGESTEKEIVESSEKEIVQNGIAVIEEGKAKIIDDKGLSVEDMLADFVNEVGDLQQQ